MRFTKDEIRRAMLLYAVTDQAWLKPGQSLLSVCEDVLANGATFLQIREKDLDADAFEAEAAKLKTLCKAHQVPYVVNDSVEIALAIDADGVHVGQSDIKGRDIRALIGPDKILGISAGTVEEAIAAEAVGADYIGVGAVFGTSTKPNARNLTVEQLREICDAVSIPVVAIGGINARNLPELKGSGVDGVAVVSAIFAATNPGAATRELLELSKEMGVMDKKYAIFDMDGTLVDSMPYWKNLAAEYLHRKGISEIPGDIPERIKPMTMSQSAELFRQEFGLTGDIEAELNAMMEDHYRFNIPLKPGVFDYLHAHRDVRMCVASATAEHLMRACLGRLGILPCFEFLLSCEAVGAGKNSPAVFLEAARRLGAHPNEIAVYEDALYAIRTAKNAGFYVVGVHDPSADPEAVKAAADEFINWEEIL